MNRKYLLIAMLLLFVIVLGGLSYHLVQVSSPRFSWLTHHTLRTCSRFFTHQPGGFHGHPG